MNTSKIRLPGALASSPRLWFIELRVSKLGFVFLLIISTMTYILYTTLFTRTPQFRLNFSKLQGYCTHITPIPIDDFHVRQGFLAHTLYEFNATAYIAEPGASAAFFGNLSSSNWRISERPLLLIISPVVSNTDTDIGNARITAKVTLLTPAFEEARARQLPIPAAAGVHYVAWPEDSDPYRLVADAIKQDVLGTVFVDGSIRNFIVNGVQTALGSNTSVSTAPREVQALRERKSKKEIELLKCANEATLLAIRAVYRKMYIGMRESEATHLLADALAAAGLRGASCLTLFGENAAFPHGSGTDRVLRSADFALFDCGGSLHGYVSDITRTVAVNSRVSADRLRIWKHVQTAQSYAFAAARAGVVTSDVDKIAREYLEGQGLGKWFTHRLGHGIGLEGHEPPYLVGGSSMIIRSGHTFSNEPGVYIPSSPSATPLAQDSESNKTSPELPNKLRGLGIRLEDCFYIDEDGKARWLTAGVGGPARSPWDP